MNRTLMQKILSALLTLCLVLGLAACGRTPEAPETEPPTTAVPETTAPAETMPPETTEPATVPTETEPQDEHFLLTLVGDCTLGYLPEHAYTAAGFPNVVGEDYEYPFRNVVSYFENDDFTMVNFEGVLGTEGYRATKTFTFRGPGEYTNILTSSSVEAVTLANNHSLDYGLAGYNETKRLLEEAYVPFVEKDGSTFFVTKSGLKIGLYAASFVIDQKDLEAEIAALREQGAEIIIFALHWGVEGSYHPFVDQTKMAQRAIDAGVDIVYGHHPHVLQRYETYNGGLIFYSLGNFCFGGNQQPSDLDTALVQVEVIRAVDGTVSLGELTIVPCSISSIPVQNNYQPTPYPEGSPDYQRVLQKLTGTWNGKNVVVDYGTAETTPPATPDSGTPDSGTTEPPAPSPEPDPAPTPDPAPAPEPDPET